MTYKNPRQIELSLSRIRPNPGQRTMREEDIVLLANAMEADGQQSAIGVKHLGIGNKFFEVVYGGLRLEAARRNGWQTIRVEIVDYDRVAVSSASENLHRAEHRVLDRAGAVKDVQSPGAISKAQSDFSIAEIVAEWNKSELKLKFQSLTTETRASFINRVFGPRVVKAAKKLIDAGAS